MHREACPPKLDKTGITLIDKIVMATTLLSLLPYSITFTCISVWWRLTYTLKSITSISVASFMCLFWKYAVILIISATFLIFLTIFGLCRAFKKLYYITLLLHSVCLGFISIKWQATLPNHDKGELVSRPPPLPLSIHLFIPALAPSSAHSGMQVCWYAAKHGDEGSEQTSRMSS